MLGPMSSYTYRCGVCRTVSAHPDEASAEAERAEHARLVHHGRHPEDQSIHYLPPPPPPTLGARLRHRRYRLRQRIDRAERTAVAALLLFFGALMALGLLYRIGELIFG
jgi:hypothetical protein